MGDTGSTYSHLKKVWSSLFFYASGAPKGPVKLSDFWHHPQLFIHGYETCHLKLDLVSHPALSEGVRKINTVT